MVLGIDFGRKKTGTAFMDMDIKIPFPCRLIEESNARKVKRALMDIIEEKNIDTVVFGLPLSDEGKESDWCAEIRRFSEFLLKSVKVDIVFVDEYGTSKEADLILRGKKKKVKNKANDLIAATLILENYLNVLNMNNKNQ
ncbi:Holliday junction resolvase RuvX [Brachyspira hyodysenteriae]|uniref:Holliday junction resolvase RuvX n=1 Tax=Brachyspira hyodysenteriae TaxID=159 RepID=UPI001ADDD88A|nr:Holliday junction resolvase RuvX [Brachyspira hyodysenteriae]MBT8718669.1 Holliday junction resolvase RuvX [Brachyspira hyodysenteriae]MBT8734075.1 Holliday junction resolvase RuvX [Brachyspira hyodysenteriae]MBT8736892.1 Holliday junction resolvase RuvX [Brachyspira hyodysenteriae]MBT8739237.1 Holliday junction resolvase RuvX [Brachyspira hyodysenteriae]MBT8742055.1 Holliday junction resolvase RuvX [Brachyspira hyodysenteriae]